MWVQMVYGGSNLDFGLLHDKDPVLFTKSIVEGHIDEAVGIARLGADNPLSTVLGVKANSSALCAEDETIEQVCRVPLLYAESMQAAEAAA